MFSQLTYELLYRFDGRKCFMNHIYTFIIQYAPISIEKKRADIINTHWEQ